MGDMRKLGAVIRREYSERVRSRWFVIATLFGPLFFGALMVLPSLLASKERDGKASRIVIVDGTGVGLGERIATNLAGGLTSDAGATRVLLVGSAGVAEAESLSTRLVVNDSISGYLVLDSASVSRGQARYAGSNTTALFDMQRLERALQRELLVWRIEQSGIDAEVGRTLATTTATVQTERLSKKGRGGSGQVNFFVGLAVAMLLYLTIFIYGLNVLRGVLEEKQTRVAEVVISSIPASRLLIGKVIGVGGVGFTQLLLWMLMSAVIWQVRTPLLASMGVPDVSTFSVPSVTPGMIVLLLAFFVTGFFLYAGLFAAAGATVSSEQEAQQAQLPIILLLVSSIIFAQNILLAPDGTLARVMSMLPHSAPIIMPLRMTVSPVPNSELAIALLSVTLGAVASTWAAGRIYRVGLLMYGKRPSVGELLKWMRAR